MRTHKTRKARMSLPALDWATKLWTALDTPVSLSCLILHRHGEYEQLVRKSITPSEYKDPLTFYLDYQAVKALSKYPYLDTKIDRRREAIGKFLEAEEQCFLTNDRMENFTHDLSAFDGSGRVNQVFHLARRKVADILGAVPELERLDFKFGPGANFGVRGDTSVHKKLVSPLECSFAFTPIVSEFLAEFPGWIPEGSHSVECCAGSELTFVPKDAKTDRPICIEPLLNGLYQKGVGSYLRDRLLHHGVDLRDQTINQRLASLAWSHDLATVDFSSASDTIAYGLILELLPIDWVEFLDVARSPQYFVEGNWYNFNKFTSMGNAYTFELETLVFYAFAYASCVVEGLKPRTGEDLHVYGDDVIIPSKAFSLFREACTFAGFTINEEKSFVGGPFFESCGADWFMGNNVRPYLLKKLPKLLTDYYYVCNISLKIAARVASLRGWHDDGFIRRRVNSLRELHAWCVGCIPRASRFLVPEKLGDVGLHCDFDVAMPYRHPQWDGWISSGYIGRPTRVVVPHHTPLALYTAGDGSERWWDPSAVVRHSEGYTQRNQRLRYRRQELFVPGDWGNLPVKWSSRARSLVDQYVQWEQFPKWNWLSV